MKQGPDKTTSLKATAPRLVRLDRLPQARRVLKVDRNGNGAIRNLSVITTGPALGHGFDVDGTTVQQIAGALENVPGRWTHGGLSDDGLARHLGRWRARGVESFALCRGCGLNSDLAALAPGSPCPKCSAPLAVAARAVGDFEFSKSAYSIQPDGLNVSAPEYLMQRAAEDPSTLGISVVAEFELSGDTATEDSPDLPPPVARLAAGPKALARADFVADPAANPLGLHAGTGALSALSEEASNQLDRIVARVGLEKAVEKAHAFLARYAAAKRKEAPMAPEKDDKTATPKPVITASNTALATTTVVATVTDEEDDAEDGMPMEPEAPAPADNMPAMAAPAAEVCPNCGAALPAKGQPEPAPEMPAMAAEVAALKAESDAAKKHALETAEKLAKAEAEWAKKVHTLTAEKVEAARLRGAKVGITKLSPAKRDQLVEALESSNPKERALGESMLSEFLADVDEAEKKLGASARRAPQQELQDKRQVEADKNRKVMLERQGWTVELDASGRIVKETDKSGKVMKDLTPKG